MTLPKIDFTNNPSPQAIEALLKGLQQHAKQTIGKTSFEPFGFLTHDDQGVLTAGCTGVFMYGVSNIRLLWVNETERGKGLGKSLMEKAELFSKENNCRYITVETFNWQAKGFYEKMGYKAELSFNGYDNDSTFYFFRKKI
jgi:ribosomal protein S18 acetylase RimI-like enzyme